MKNRDGKFEFRTLDFIAIVGLVFVIQGMAKNTTPNSVDQGEQSKNTSQYKRETIHFEAVYFKH